MLAGMSGSEHEAAQAPQPSHAKPSCTIKSRSEAPRRPGPPQRRQARDAARREERRGSAPLGSGCFGLCRLMSYTSYTITVAISLLEENLDRLEGLLMLMPDADAGLGLAILA